ncbi:MAG: acyl carrier protein [Eubacteriaceae bacterium]
MDANFLKIRKIIAEQMDVPEEDISLETSLIADLDADSLDIVELVMAFEDEFNVKIEDDELEKILTVDDIVNAIS